MHIFKYNNFFFYNYNSQRDRIFEILELSLREINMIDFTSMLRVLLFYIKKI